MIEAILAGAGLLSKILGGGAKGASDNRAAQNQYQLNQGTQDTARYGIQQGASTNAANATEAGALNRAKMGIESSGTRAKQALLGSLLQNLHSVKVQPPAGVHMGTVTGGLNDIDGILGPNARAAGGALSSQALQALLSGSDVPAATDFKASVLTPPTTADYQGPGKLESILSGGSLLGLLLGGAGTLADLIKGNGASSPTPFYQGQG